MKTAQKTLNLVGRLVSLAVERKQILRSFASHPLILRSLLASPGLKKRVLGGIALRKSSEYPNPQGAQK